MSTLNNSGPISLGGSTSGQSVNLQLGKSATATISFNDSNVRSLTGTSANTQLSMPSQFWGKGFTPVTHTYSTPGSGTETVPSGATTVAIQVWGGGGSGAFRNAGAAGGGGGGGGGYTTQTISVSGISSFSYTVGSGGNAVSSVQNGQAGSASTVSGGAGAVSMTANGGGAGIATPAAGGAGGTYSGTGTGTNGSAGTAGSVGNGGNGGASPNGGGTATYSSGFADGNAPGGGGTGGNSNYDLRSGYGAGGQIIFYYT